MPASTRSKSKACKAAGKRGKYLQTVKPFAEKFDPALWVPKEWKCKSTVFYRTPAPIIVYYFPYITCLLYLLFLIKHVRTSG